MTEAPIDLGEIDDEVPPSPIDEGPAEVASVPSGFFANLDALCNPQAEPRCVRAPDALANVTVRLRAPILEVQAIEVETGLASELHLAVRTAEGWTAVPHASVASFHDDPGCASIERDAGLRSIAVDDRASLELVETSVRGALVDDGEQGDTGALTAFDELVERVVRCDVSSGALSCGEPRVLSLTRVPSAS